MYGKLIDYKNQAKELSYKVCFTLRMKLTASILSVDSEEHSMYAIITEPCSLPRRNSGYSVAHGSYHAAG